MYISISNYIIFIFCKCLLGHLIRLVGGSSYNEGRVEVNYNGEWGTVCDDGWDETDAGVVCRQLGFGSSGTAIGSAGFGQGSGSILLSNMLCNGGESILSSCGHLGINVTSSCSHINDAGIRCSGAQGLVICLKLRIHLKIFDIKYNYIVQSIILCMQYVYFIYKYLLWCYTYVYWRYLYGGQNL